MQILVKPVDAKPAQRSLVLDAVCALARASCLHKRVRACTDVFDVLGDSTCRDSRVSGSSPNDHYARRTHPTARVGGRRVQFCRLLLYVCAVCLQVSSMFMETLHVKLEESARRRLLPAPSAHTESFDSLPSSVADYADALVNSDDTDMPSAFVRCVDPTRRLPKSPPD